MNGYQRMMAALRGKPHDKIPVMLHNFMTAAEEFNVTMGQFRENPVLIADVLSIRLKNTDWMEYW